MKPESRKRQMMESIATQYTRNQAVRINSKISNLSLRSRQTVKSLSEFSAHPATSIRSYHIPIYSNTKTIPKPVTKSEEDLEPNALEIMSCFTAGTLAAFSGLYVGDSISAQSKYIKEVIDVSDSQIGLLGSCIFMGSLFMPLVCAPFIDKYGPIRCGIFMNLYNCLLCLPMPFLYNNYTALLVVRIIAGAFPEATFSVESAMIVRYLPKRLESLGFGVCMSVATSANLISFFAIPHMMGDMSYEYGLPPGDLSNQKYIRTLVQTFWLNEYVSIASLVLFVLFCIPLFNFDRKLEAFNKNRRNAEKEQQTTQINDSFSFDEGSLLNEDDEIFGTHVRDYNAFRNKQSQNVEILAKLEAFPTETTIPDNIPTVYKLYKALALPLDFWIVSSAFCMLLSVCYGAQTMLITFLDYHISYSSTCGIVRSTASIFGGPIAGVIVSWIGKRPELELLCFLLAIASFISLFWSSKFPAYIPMALIGFFDGCSATLGKSLFNYVVSPQQLNNAFAFGGIMLNIGEFVFPPIAGACTGISFPVIGGGIIWYYIIMLIAGTLLSVAIIVRDRKMFNGILSKEPE